MATNQTNVTDISSRPDEVGPVILAVALSLIVAVSISGNLLTIAAFVKDRSLRSKPTNLFILGLSCADLVIAFTIPLKVGHALCSYWPYGKTVCQLEVFFNDVGVVSGMWCMAAIALDRYLLISRDYARYLDLQSHRNVVRTIAVVFSMSIVVAVLEITLWNVRDWMEDYNDSYSFDRYCLSPPRKNVIYASTVFFIALFLPILLMVALSLRFLVLLRRRLQKFKKQSNVLKHTGAKSSKETTQSQAFCLISEIRKMAIMENNELEETSNVKANGAGGSTPFNVRNADTHSPERPGGHTPINMEQAHMGTHEQASNQHHPTERDISSKPEIMRDRYIRPAIILAALITTFLLFSLPYIIFISAIVRIDKSFPHVVHFHLFNVLFLNSCIGPIIYAWTHPKIHKFHSNLFASIKNKILCKG